MSNRICRLFVLAAFVAVVACLWQFSAANTLSQQDEKKGLIERVSYLEEQLTTLSEKLDALESPIAARYRCPSQYDQDIAIGSGGGIVNFSVMDYDTHNAVTPGENKWQFKAPKTGVYTVTAYACCTQYGVESKAGGTAVALYRNGKVNVYLSQLVPSLISNTMLGGTTDVELTEGDTIDVRVNGFGDAANLMVSSAGATWFSIRYVRSATKSTNPAP